MEGKGELFKKRSGGMLLEWVSQLEDVKAKLEDVEDKRGIFPDEDTKFIISALKSEIGEIKDRIEKGIKGKSRGE